MSCRNCQAIGRDGFVIGEKGVCALKTEYKNALRKLAWMLFIIYLLMMAYFLFFSEYLNRGGMGTVYRYNLTLFQEVKRSFWCFRAGDYRYFLLNLIMNVVAFVPFGFFLPLLSSKRKKRKLIYVVLSVLQFTCVIEILQLVLKVGIFDVDDILLNTVGGFIGYILFCMFQGIRRLLRKVF